MNFRFLYIIGVTASLSGFSSSDILAAEGDYFWGENNKDYVCGRYGEKQFKGQRIGGYIRGDKFIIVLATDGTAVTEISTDGVISGRKYLKIHRKYNETKYTHYDGKIVGDEIHMHIRQALADKTRALCDYGVLVLTKTEPPKEPSEEEKALSKVIQYNEQFTNALSRYQSAKNCLARGGKDAENIIRSMVKGYRKNRDDKPAYALVLLRASIENHFKIADTAIAMKCPDLADNQYRAVKRSLRNVDMPEYQERLEAGVKSLIQ